METEIIGLTAQHVRNVLDYDADTGIFRWRQKVAQRVKIGDLAGSRHYSGYLTVFTLGKSHRLHRLAWLHVYGAMPDCHIDHINGVKFDNRIVNLRLSNPTENAQNRRRQQRGAKSGLLGVARNGNNWQAYIRVNKVPMYLGTFKTPEEAHQRYLDAKRKYHIACTI